MRVCEANDQRRKIQQIDKKFKAGCKTKFQRTSARRTGSIIRVNGELITDYTAVLCAWKDHFETLGQSRSNVNEVIQTADTRVQELLSESHHNREDILDTAFQLEEIENGLNKLKLKKSPDHSGITAEHLRYGGHSLKLWLLQAINAIVDLEAIPDYLNLAIMTPVYKGSGKDPLDRGSYRGISVTPVITKLLELLLLARLEPHLEELGIPHANQSGYRKYTSCADAIFSTAELVSYYLSQRENMYLCCYDLQKAFDSVEYGVLLCQLYDVGINAKLWRLIQKWYTGPKC